MTLNVKFHSDHIEALKVEIKKKFKNELNSSNDGYLKRCVKEVLNCLDQAIVPVSILRSVDFNSVLDKSKNFYGLKMHYISQNAHIHAKIPNIRRSLQLTTQMMNPKDVWKFFLSTVLMELQSGTNFSNLLKIGSDYKFINDQLTKETADMIIAGPRSNMDFPLLLVDICTSDDDCKSREGNKFNSKKMQNMMTNSLIDFYNTRTHWPLPQLNHLSVYGIIVMDYEFYICKMALRPEKNAKFAFVYTQGKRFLPRNLLADPKPSKSFDEEALAEVLRGDLDSTEDEYESSEDDWVTCYTCETCHYRGEGCIYSGFEELSITESESETPKKKKDKNVKTVKNENSNQIKKIITNGAKDYRRPHGGGVASIVALLQTVIAQQEYVKANDQKYKHLKSN